MTEGRTNEHGNSRRRFSFFLIVYKTFFPLNFSQPFVTFLKDIPLLNLSVLVLNNFIPQSCSIFPYPTNFVVTLSVAAYIAPLICSSCQEKGGAVKIQWTSTRQKHLRIRSISLEHWIVSQDFRLLKLWNSSVLHQNEGSIGKSRGSREISRAEGMDFPIPPESWWSTDIHSSLPGKDWLTT